MFFQRFGTRGERRLTLGTYSRSFGLAHARAAADQARAEHAAGRDPISAKQADPRGTRLPGDLGSDMCGICGIVSFRQGGFPGPALPAAPKLSRPVRQDPVDGDGKLS